MDIKKAINKVVNLEDLTERETRSVFAQIMNGKATAGQIGSFITALRMKGETVPEITGAARVMREKALKIRVRSAGSRILDTCGTGGTGTKTFNISTTVAFVAAGCGIKVAKHGNRGVSSKCGSADLLEELGVNVSVTPKTTEKCINEIGIGFLFAPLFHGAMKHAIGPRREVGLRTIFNILGPLSNPALAKRQLMGVYDPKLTETMARVLGNLGCERAFVVNGKGPLDEVSTLGKTRISELRSGMVRTYDIMPGDLGLKKAKLEDILGGTAKKNARVTLSVLSGKKGPQRDIVLANAAVALVAAGKTTDLRKAVKDAEVSIDSGKAMEKLSELVRMTNKRKR